MRVSRAAPEIGTTIEPSSAFQKATISSTRSGVGYTRVLGCTAEFVLSLGTPASRTRWHSGELGRHESEPHATEQSALALE